MRVPFKPSPELYQIYLQHFEDNALLQQFGASSSGINVYRGSSYHPSDRVLIGRGLGGFFKGIFTRFVKPLVESSLVRHAGKTLKQRSLEAGVGLLSDQLHGEKIGSALKKRAIEGVVGTLGDTANYLNQELIQKGQGSARKPYKKKRKTLKRKINKAKLTQDSRHYKNKKRRHNKTLVDIFRKNKK